MSVLRLDRGEITPAKRLATGGLRVDARIARTGVQSYRQPDGTVRRELRHPEDVFAADSLESFQMLPVTRGHPAEPVTAENCRQFQVGSIGESVRADGRFVVSHMSILDKDTAEAIESGAERELSGGYYCDLEMTPGIYEGEEYDARQRNIIGNHVAIVAKGRAGPDVAIRLDAGDAIAVDGEPPRQPALPPTNPTSDLRKDGVPVTVMLNLDGVDFPAEPQLAQAVRAQLARKDAEIASVKTDAAAEKAVLEAKVATAAADLEKEKARADDLDEKLQAEKKARADAENPEARRQAVRDRLALEREAIRVLGEDVKTDEMDDLEIKRAVIVHVSPSAADKIKGASESYIQARYDAALETASEKGAPVSAGADRLRSVATRPAERKDAHAAAREEMHRDAEEAWKQPLA